MKVTCHPVCKSNLFYHFLYQLAKCLTDQVLQEETCGQGLVLRRRIEALQYPKANLKINHEEAEKIYEVAGRRFTDLNRVAGDSGTRRYQNGMLYGKGLLLLLCSSALEYLLVP